MDPSYVSDKPGKSPMGMDLVPVYEDAASAGRPGTIIVSPVVVQNMGIRTTPVLHGPLRRSIRTVGTIDYDEGLVRDVTTKFDGWIEELYVDYTGQYVERGKPLFRVYSPELYSSQEEYLLALRYQNSVQSKALPEAARDMKRLIESSRLRLEFFDISEEQIKALEERGTPSKTLTVVSPHTGIVVEKMARDGMKVRPGMKLYTIADLSRVWANVDIYENEAPFVKIGQDAIMELSYLPGEAFHGKVIYVYPFVSADTRTLTVRLEFDNPHLQLKPGMFANVSIEAGSQRQGLMVPRSVVIDTGRRKVAFVALGSGKFEPRQIVTGVDLGEDQVEVLDGLVEGESVVVSGQFMLDSESKLREAVLKMMEQRRGSTSEVAGGRENRAPLRGAGENVGGEERSPKPPTEKRASEEQSGVAAPELATAIRPVLDAYLELQLALSSGDSRVLDLRVTSLQAALSRLTRQALERGARDVDARASTALEALPRMFGRSLDAVRAQFKQLSREVIALVELAGTGSLGDNIYVMRCPMADGQWIQQGSEPANPYYGASMLRCGEATPLVGEEAPSGP
ncbi:MAG: efflux RND transporter periplasmic adaptor subunit [Candidatus Binatia bacterium]